jgi:hypothetical protein
MHTDSTIRSITWTVPSTTTPGVTYLVRADSPTGLLRCSCPASQYPKTRGRCWHLKAVHAGMAGKPRVRVTAITRAA